MDFVHAQVTHSFPASAEQVFDAWLSPELVAQWMSATLRSHGLTGEMRRVEINPQVGGRFVFSDLRNGVEPAHWGTYQVIDRPRKLVFSWFTSPEAETEAASLVTINIQSAGTGSLVTLVHRMPAAYADYVERTEKSWGRMMDHIESLILSTR